MKRLQFAITRTPEIFQRKMLETLRGLKSGKVFMDDILVHGTSMELHDARPEKVLQCVESADLKLNKEKCSLRQSNAPSD